MSYYTAIIALTWAALAVLSILVIENDRLPHKQKRVLIFTYVVVALAAFSEWLGLQLNGNTDYSPWILKTVKCFDYILTPLAGGVMVLQFDGRSINRTIMDVLLIVNTVFQICALFKGWMLTVDSTNHYSHGPLYKAYVGMYLLLIILIIIEYLFYGRNFRRQNRLSLYASMLLAISGIIIQETLGVRTAYLALTLALTLLFIHRTEFVQLATDDTMKEQRFRILMSQIKPHFLYNTLGAIQELCESNPKQAADATAKFSRYLRGNMDSLSNTELIPFAQELEHTRLYLELEKVRFESALRVTAKIGYVDFMIPSLTLQPIVENAVRHGVRGKKHATGTVCISSLCDAEGYRIIVEDDGPGFDSAEVALRNDGESHIGIANVKERLQRMCGGSLTIDSAPGQGTRATIFIPKDYGKGNKKGKTNRGA